MYKLYGVGRLQHMVKIYVKTERVLWLRYHAAPRLGCRKPVVSTGWAVVLFLSMI